MEKTSNNCSGGVFSYTFNEYERKGFLQQVSGNSDVKAEYLYYDFQVASHIFETFYNYL